MRIKPCLFTGLLAFPLLLAGCATPQARVEAGLMKAGLPQPMAECMADRMVRKLSITQLRRLQSLSTVPKTDYRAISIDQFVHKVRALEDPEIIGVTSKAALICALRG